MFKLLTNIMTALFGTHDAFYSQKLTTLASVWWGRIFRPPFFKNNRQLGKAFVVQENTAFVRG
jgi:hypothetical protein